MHLIYLVNIVLCTCKMHHHKILETKYIKKYLYQLTEVNQIKSCLFYSATKLILRKYFATKPNWYSDDKLMYCDSTELLTMLALNTGKLNHKEVK